MTRISPIILLVIVIAAIAFFALGLIQLVMRCLMKRPSISESNRFPEYSSSSHTFNSQLQHLFRLHDSGLDQSLVDSLSVFYYKDIIGISKEPFDCAVCLCEFSCFDKLKSLPNCSHAFHIHCIETWLLSNSTCPLCRGLITSENPIANPLEEASSSQENEGENRVFCVRIGKFKKENEIEDEVSSRSRGIDARRCYSMGAFEYIVNDANNLQVVGCKQKEQLKLGDNNADGYKINARTRGESFSVTKIWLWSKT